MHDPQHANHHYPPTNVPSSSGTGPSGTPPYPPPMATPTPGFRTADHLDPGTGGYTLQPEQPPGPPPPDTGFAQMPSFGNRKLLLPLLAGLVALFVITSAVFIILFLNTRSDLAAARATITKYEATINDADKKIKKLGGSNDDLEDDIEKAEADSKAARECIDAFQAWLDEATKKKPDKSTVKDLADKANTACREFW